MSIIPDSLPAEIDGTEVSKIEPNRSTNGVEDILYLGRMKNLKGIHSLLEAKKSFPDMMLHMVGDGPDRGEFESLVSRENIPGVQFHGFVSPPWEYLRLADVIVIPSVVEPFGIVALEAGIFGVPVICSAVDGLAEVVPDDRFGYRIKPTIQPNRFLSEQERSKLPQLVVRENDELAPPQFLDPKDLQACIRHIDKNPDEAIERSENFRNRILERYTIENFFGKINHLFEKYFGVDNQP